MTADASDNPIIEIGDKGAIMDKLLCWLSARDGSIDKQTQKDKIMKEFNDDDVKKVSVDVKKCSNSKIKLQISIQPLTLLDGKSSLILIMSLLVDH